MPQLLSGRDENQTTVVRLHWLLLATSILDQDYLNFKPEGKAHTLFKKWINWEKLGEGEAGVLKIDLCTFSI